MRHERLGLEPLIDPTANVSDSVLGRFTEIGARTSFAASTLGDYSYVVNDSEIIYTDVGKFCSIAAHTRINPGNHPMQRASQSHFTYRASAYFDDATDDADFFAWRQSFLVKIGHDVWIGHGAIILPGRVVGTGAVIAGGAVVTKDVPDYAIVAGNPAKIIRYRFPQLVIIRLLSLQWWDWSHARLRETLDDFRHLSIEAFLDKHGG